MEWIDGIQVEEEEWDKLPSEIRHKICYRIGLQLQQLRSIPPPQPRYYGRVNDQGFTNIFIGGNRRHELTAGPFYTYDSYLERLFTYARWRCANHIVINGRTPENVSDVARFVSSIWLEQFSHDKQVCEPKLTHGDVKLRNIVFAKSHKDNQERLEDRDVVLIDWESLAWEPAWSEIDHLLTDFNEACDPNGPWMSYIGFAKAIKPFPYAAADTARTMLANMTVR